MKKLWKCSVCGFVHEGDPIEKCPKCDSPWEKFNQLTEEEAGKVYASDRTNDIHAELIRLSMEIVNLCKEGIEINLDPPCVSCFERAQNEAWIIKQRSKAEVAGHMGRGKW